MCIRDRDEAFCFYYEDNLDALRMNGAELVFFSPMRDAALPVNCGGVYLGGGYPELYLPELSANERMRTELCLAVLRGMPTVAECGGFLYLQSAMRAEDGRRWEMVGVFPGEGFPTGGLRRFGYLTLTAETDSLLFKKGECCPAHEFHYWDCNANGKDFSAKKWNGSPWRCGFAEMCIRDRSISARLLAGGTVTLRTLWPVLGNPPSGVVVAQADGEYDFALTIKRKGRDVLRIVPRIAVLGVGCKEGTSREAIEEAFSALLAKSSLYEQAVYKVCSLSLIHI